MKCANCENTEFTCVCGTLVDGGAPRLMPTREQIAERIDRLAFDRALKYYDSVGCERRREYALEKADAVLALLSGAES